MLFPLVWWAFPVGFSIAFICIGILRGIQYLHVENMSDDRFPHIPFILVSLGIVAFYIIAIFSYKSVKKSTQNNLSNDLRPNVLYEIPKGNKDGNERLRMYPALVLEI